MNNATVSSIVSEFVRDRFVAETDARTVIADTLILQYTNILNTGWQIERKVSERETLYMEHEAVSGMADIHTLLNGCRNQSFEGGRNS